MTPEAQQAIDDLVAVTGNQVETVREICETMGAEPAKVAHMAIARMHRDLHPAQYSEDPPSEAEREAAAAVPAPLQPGEPERLIEQLQAAADHRDAIAKKYAP